MKLKEYIENLQKIAEKYPDLEVIYAKDEEGNGFSQVCFTPTLGQFHDGEFEGDEGENPEMEVNSVCIN